MVVSYGEYFKYIDEMARSLDGFKILWRRKKWTLFPLTDTVWVMFYYIQLYICAFSFVSTLYFHRFFFFFFFSTVGLTSF